MNSEPTSGEVAAWVAGESDNDDVADWLARSAAGIPYTLTGKYDDEGRRKNLDA